MVGNEDSISKQPGSLPLTHSKVSWCTTIVSPTHLALLPEPVAGRGTLLHPLHGPQGALVHHQLAGGGEEAELPWRVEVAHALAEGQRHVDGHASCTVCPRENVPLLHEKREGVWRTSNQ